MANFIVMNGVSMTQDVVEHETKSALICVICGYFLCICG